MDRRYYQSKTGFFYISIGGEVYRFHIEIGPFAMCWEKRIK